MLLVPVGKGPAACARSRRGRRVPAPTARAMGAGLPAPAARERFECPKARREACALWALGPKAQSDPKRGSETMSATVREARMIEQPGHKKRASPHRPACYPGANRPHHPSEVWRAAALQAEIRIPGAFPKSSIWRRHPARARDRLPASSGRPASLTCAVDSAALRKQGYLTPAAARRSRRQSRRRSRRPAHPRRKRSAPAELFRRPTAVCRSSPRCPR